MPNPTDQTNQTGNAQSADDAANEAHQGSSSGNSGAGNGSGGGDQSNQSAQNTARNQNQNQDQNQDQGDAHQRTNDDGVKTYPVKVKGETRWMTLEEMQTAATKAYGADERFNEAARMREEAADAIRMRSLMFTAKDEEKPMPERMAALRELSVLMGEDPSQLNFTGNGAPSGNSQNDQNNQGNGAEGGSAGDSGVQLPHGVKLEDLPQEAQDAIRYSQEQKRAQRREQLFGIVKDSLDNDPVLGKLEDAGLKNYLEQTAKNEVQRRVVAAGEQFSSDLVADILQGLRGVADMIGKAKAAQDSNDGGNDPNMAQGQMEMLEYVNRTYPGLLNLGSMGSPAHQPQAQDSGNQSGGDVFANATGNTRRTRQQGSQSDSFANASSDDWVGEFMTDVRKKMRKYDARGNQASSLNR